jgi:hypothetical protein
LKKKVYLYIKNEAHIKAIKKYKRNQQATEQLLKALLHQAFKVKETETV